jgi:hypothetical protein
VALANPPQRIGDRLSLSRALGFTLLRIPPDVRAPLNFHHDCGR